MIRIQAWNEFVSPKFYGSLAIWPWLKISPQSSLFVIYLIITAWQWLMSFAYTPCIPMQIKPPPKKGLSRVGALSSWESGCAVPFPPQGSVIHVNLSHISHNAVDTACWWLCQLLIFIFIMLYRYKLFSHTPSYLLLKILWCVTIHSILVDQEA